MRARFGEQLKKWREDAGITQDALAKRIGKSPAFVSQTEKGTGGKGRSGLGPPSKADCDKIGEALNRPDDEVWTAAAPERMGEYDPDLEAFYRWVLIDFEGKMRDAERGYEQRLTAASNLTDSEASLFLWVRRFAASRPDVKVTSGVCALLQALHSENDPTNGRFFERLGDLPLGSRCDLVRLLDNATAAALKYRRVKEREERGLLLRAGLSNQTITKFLRDREDEGAIRPAVIALSIAEISAVIESAGSHRWGATPGEPKKE